MPDEVHGLPSLNLDECIGSKVPYDWNIKGVLGDILMCEYVDQNEHDEVLRGGIYVKQDVTQNIWRVAKILQKGPATSDRLKIGDLIMFPGNRGIPMVNFKGQHIIFLNEERVFAVVEERE